MPEVTLDSCDSPVTVVISRKVKRGKEAEFEAFLVGVNAACMKYDGHLGTNIFRPSSEADSDYRVIFKFDCLSNLRRWEESEDRQQWFAQAEALTERPPHIQILTGLETWFTLPGQSTITPPPRYKMALVSWLAVYPLITAISTLLQDELNPLPIAGRTLIVTAIAIPTMTYLIMPRMTRLFAWWLYPVDSNPSDSQPNQITPVLEPGKEPPFPDFQPLQSELETEVHY